MDRPALQPHRWRILAVVVTACMAIAVDLPAVVVTLPDLGVALGLPRPVRQGVLVGYLLAVVAVLPVARVLCRRADSRAVLLGGLALLVIGGGGAAAATGSSALLAARLLAGAGAASVLAGAGEVLLATFGPAEQSRARGIALGFAGLAVLLGPVLAGTLLGWFGWPAGLLIGSPLALAAGVGVLRVVPRSRAASSPHRWATSAVVGDPVISVALAALAVAFAALTGGLFLAAHRLRLEYGVVPVAVGAQVALALLSFALVTRVVLPTARRRSPADMAAAGVLLVAVAVAGLGHVSVPQLGVAGLLVVLGGGAAFVVGPASAAVRGRAPRRLAAAASGLDGAARQVGAAVGVAVLGLAAPLEPHAAVAHALPPVWAWSLGSLVVAVGVRLGLTQPAGTAVETSELGVP